VPWVRFDDQFPIHRKVDGLTDAAYRLHTSAIFWSARNLTDGFVSREDLDGVTARVRTPSRFAAECVKRGVWHDARQDCPSPKCPGPVDNDGWIVHDYWDYQPKKEQVVGDREAAARRQAKWRAAHNGSSNGVSNAVSSHSPPRPEGKRGGQAAPAARASPAGAAASGAPTSKPPWCGQCDELTRLSGDPPRRCPNCHPLTVAAGEP
jgi:hypothetical protein